MTAKQRELRLTDYLEHMREAAGLACSYVEGMVIGVFRTDKKTQQAVILNLMIIGEAATQILNGFPEFARNHPEVPWKEMRGMRNRMAHGYFEINLDLVWDTIQASIPSLTEKVEMLLT